MVSKGERVTGASSAVVSLWGLTLEFIQAAYAALKGSSSTAKQPAREFFRSSEVVPSVALFTSRPEQNGQNAYYLRGFRLASLKAKPPQLNRP